MKLRMRDAAKGGRSIAWAIGTALATSGAAITWGVGPAMLAAGASVLVLVHAVDHRTNE